MDQAESTASPKRRVTFVVVAALLLVLWGLSLIPLIKTWGDPYEDGLSFVPAFTATMTCLPVAVYLFVGAIAGHGRHVTRARTAVFFGKGLLFLVVAGASFLVAIMLL
jgi:hypothetical protein